MVADFEAERDVDKMQQIAQLIYESFISSSFDTQLNLSSVSKKEIIFDVQNGLIRSDMFDNAKKEVQLLLAHDLFPRFVLHLSARVRERAALAAVVPKVEKQRRLNVYECADWKCRLCCLVRKCRSFGTACAKEFLPLRSNLPSSRTPRNPLKPTISCLAPTLF
jgi:hypothetical protein